MKFYIFYLQMDATYRRFMNLQTVVVMIFGEVSLSDANVWRRYPAVSEKVDLNNEDRQKQDFRINTAMLTNSVENIRSTE